MIITAMQGMDAGPFVYRFSNTHYYHTNLFGQFAFCLFIPSALLGFPWVAVGLSAFGLSVHVGSIALDMGWRRIRSWLAGWALPLGFLALLVGIPIWMITSNTSGRMPPVWHIAAAGGLLIALWYALTQPEFRKRQSNEHNDTVPEIDTSVDLGLRMKALEIQLTGSEIEKLVALPQSEQTHLMQQSVGTIRKVLERV